MLPSPLKLQQQQLKGGFKLQLPLAAGAAAALAAPSASSLGFHRPRRFLSPQSLLRLFFLLLLLLRGLRSAADG